MSLLESITSISEKAIEPIPRNGCYGRIHGLTHTRVDRPDFIGPLRQAGYLEMKIPTLFKTTTEFLVPMSNTIPLLLLHVKVQLGCFLT